MRKALLPLLLLVGCGGGGKTTPPPPPTPTPPKVSQGCAPRPDAGGGFEPACLPDFPHVRSHSNRLMTPMKMVTLVPSNSTHSAEIFAFADQVGGSQWWRSVAPEYGLTTLTNVNVTGPVMSSSLSDSQLQAYISRAVSNGIAPAPDGNTLYVLYLSESFQVEVQGYCGYHSPYASGGSGLDSYAIVGWCTPFPGESAFDSVTETASHEIFEAATDPADDTYLLTPPVTSPWNQTVWTLYHQSGAVELGDLCEGTRVFEAVGDGGYRYQRQWSNKYADRGDDPCAPHLAIPYYNVAADKEWFEVSVGGSVDVPLTGWATDPAVVWSLGVDTLGGSQSFLTSTTEVVSLGSDLGEAREGPTCNLHTQIKNGAHATATIHAPSGARSGDFAVFMAYSIQRDPDTCHARLDDDPYHYTIFGVHVR